MTPLLTMTDYHELMRILSRPRPNGSPAERETRDALTRWLEARRIPYRLHAFRLYPYFFECVGVWLVLSRTLLAAAVWLRWGWVTLPIALLGLLGGALDTALHLPLVTWPGARRGENLLLEFGPPEPRREVVLCAHYDSKTELLDHRQRAFFLKHIPAGIALSLALGLLGPLDAWLHALGSPWADLSFRLGAALSVPLLFLAWGFGLHLSLGRWLEPSQGAVDNGAACAILLGLAQRLAAGEIPLQKTRVTLALFTGEEVNMQGSRAYVKSREWPLPAAVVNLEIMAQDGDYVLWEQDGDAFRLLPTAPRLNELLSGAVQAATGIAPRRVGPVNSDAASFLFAGLPATTLGAYDARLADTGLHRPSDNLARVVMSRLPEGVRILEHFLEEYVK
ncbi:MAG: Zn-dependent exopeptidase M28 [Chloroflexi bacterium]|nr:Zn-dependent exopeptidase M28 [Chloroflexota bacterium]